MGKYLKLFANHAAYSQAESSLDKPNVAVCQQEGDVHYNPYDPFNGHAYVDLGLPSGTKWATMNVGATNITDYGTYVNYGFLEKDTYPPAHSVYSGSENPLDLSRDLAHVSWGGSWHIPTKSQLDELVANTQVEFINNYMETGVNVGIFRKDEKELIIPAGGYFDATYGSNPQVFGTAGFIWSSTPVSNKAYYLATRNTTPYYYINYDQRTVEFNIRPVIG